jgi:DNA-binding MarR family transcriptional regulator
MPTIRENDARNRRMVLSGTRWLSPTPQQLAARVELDPAPVLRHLRALVRLGFVEIVGLADPVMGQRGRRASRYTITALGRQELQRLEQEAEAARAALGNLTSELRPLPGRYRRDLRADD